MSNSKKEVGTSKNKAVDDASPMSSLRLKLKAADLEIQHYVEALEAENLKLQRRVGKMQAENGVLSAKLRSA